MSDLIDRNVLKAKMYQEAFESDTDMQKWDSGCWIRYKLFEKVVDSTPTVPYGPRWHRVEEPPKMDELTPMFFASELILMYNADSGSTYLGYARSNEKNGKISWIVDSAEVEVTHWMPIEPPREDV